ncbi:MAG: PIG-L family deacetylase, partial [Armatimonadetes bacterium]|nr:PIG-L family deacetylase [Anaerolineae bacterium]
MHLLIAPHPDDVALSIGGTLAALADSGAPCIIWTLMAGDPPSPLPDTPLVAELHAR